MSEIPLEETQDFKVNKLLLKLAKKFMNKKFYIEESMGTVNTGLKVSDISPKFDVDPFKALSLLEEQTMLRYSDLYAKKINLELILVYNCDGDILVAIEK